MRKILLGFFIISVLILTACAVQQQAPPSEEKMEKKELQGSYKIGVMYPLSGDKKILNDKRIEKIYLGGH